jgi:hypothetical protein
MFGFDIMIDNPTRVYGYGMARDCFIARSGEREQASNSGDRAFDEGPVGAEERACSTEIVELKGVVFAVIQTLRGIPCCRGVGCREHGEEREEKEKIKRGLKRFNFLIFLIVQGYFRNFNSQNDVVLCFPSILTAQTNRGAYFIRD